MTAVLPRRLPVPITASDGRSNGSYVGNAKREIGALVGDAEREEPARQPEPLARTEDRLVGDVHGDLRLEPRDRLLEVGRKRYAVLVAADELLGPPDEERADDLVRNLGQGVAHDRRVVLSINQRQRPHLVVTSPSIRAVYFSNARVSSENWMIRSCPWNGYLRQTSTCFPCNSMTL